MKKLWNKFKNFFLDHINWCHKTLSTGEDKPITRFYQFFCYLFWPIPWMDRPCWCCAGTRGIAYGIIIGIILHYLWGIIV